MHSSVRTLKMEDMEEKNQNLSGNLRQLCATRASVSQVCREIGINRQQFNKYLSGAALPSAHNLRRICDYFGIGEIDLFRPLAEFEKISQVIFSNSGGPMQAFQRLFTENLRKLRDFEGVYHSFNRSPSWDGGIVCSLVRLQEKDGLMTVKTLEFAAGPANTAREVAKYEGIACYRQELLFVVEYDLQGGGCLSQTVLNPPFRHQRRYLRGMASGVSWRPGRRPFTSPSIWRKVEPTNSLRDAMNECGGITMARLKKDPIVAAYMTSSGTNEVALYANMSDDHRL